MTALRRRWLVCWVVLPRSCDASGRLIAASVSSRSSGFLTCSDDGCCLDKSIDVWHRPDRASRGPRLDCARLFPAISLHWPCADRKRAESAEQRNRHHRHNRSGNSSAHPQNLRPFKRNGARKWPDHIAARCQANNRSDESESKGIVFAHRTRRWRNALPPTQLLIFGNVFTADMPAGGVTLRTHIRNVPTQRSGLGPRATGGGASRFL
jgi:hypothetical protein